MIMQMYSVYDKKVEAFMPPMFMRSRGEAMRSFMDAVQKDGTQFCTHPEDFALAFLGTFDDVSAKVEVPETGPVMVMQGMDCVLKEKVIQ